MLPRGRRDQQARSKGGGMTVNGSPLQDRSRKRREWFKLLACPSHTWPIQTCDGCWLRIIAQLERDAREATK